jgi:hypothetical protein
MTEQGLIVLMTDFGLRDGYGAILKGVIARINPHVQVIDLTHDIPPQDLWAGSFCLMNAYPYFPLGTVYIAVVDPGVGTQRRGVAVKFREGYLVGPDNGLLSGILSLSAPLDAVNLTNTSYWRTITPSATFQGRDIFAPVGAHLANGVPLALLGDAIETSSLTTLPMAFCQVNGTEVNGMIQYIDGFGNLISNIPALVIAQGVKSVVLKDKKIIFAQTYSDVTKGEAVALIGSHGMLEIAISGGNAQETLSVGLGTPLFVKME